jgi:hypothetical protein
MDLAAHDDGPDWLLSTRLLPAWTPSGLTLLSLGALAERAEAADPHAALPALYPSEEPGRYIFTSWPVWRLDASERALIAEIFGVRFEPPPRRAGARGVWTRARDRLGHWWQRGAGLLRHRGRPVPESGLTAAERALRDALQGAEEVAVCFTDGDAPPREISGRLCLPQRHPDVALALQAAAVSPDSAYLGALALGRAPGREARERWRRGLGQLP